MHHGKQNLDLEDSDLQYTSSDSDDHDSFESNDSHSSQGDGLFMDKLHKNGRFNLKMGQCDLSGGIGFITKFTRVFRSIKEIDFGQKKLEAEDMEKFGDVLKLNKYIEKVCYKKKDISKHQAHLIEEEIEKNKAIYEVNKAQKDGFDIHSKKLDLAGKSLKNLKYLPKMIKEFKDLEVLDLSKADLRTNDSVLQVCKMIDENDTIESLIL